MFFFKDSCLLQGIRNIHFTRIEAHFVENELGKYEPAESDVSYNLMFNKSVFDIKFQDPEFDIANEWDMSGFWENESEN